MAAPTPCTSHSSLVLNVVAVMVSSLFMLMLTHTTHYPVTASRAFLDVHGANAGAIEISKCNKVHAIKPEDTCFDIAKQNDMTLDKLLTANSGSTNNHSTQKAGNMGDRSNNSQPGKGQDLQISNDHQEPSAKHSPGSVFRVYIGVDWDNVKFKDVPIPDDIEVHGILAFGIDYNRDNRPTNGKFLPYWDESLTPDTVKEVKKKHPNVKVMVSLGGDTLNGEFVFFTPDDKASWVKNAVQSLTDMGNEYDLDGIDIDYEHFKTDESVFAECMGEVIQQLKDKGRMVVASIAPFDEVESHYKALWDRHSQIIDYVNFQFYTYDADTSTEELLKLYDKAERVYKGGHVLTSFTTDHPQGGLKFAPTHIFDASQQLKKQGRLPGIFSWLADTSALSMFKQELLAESLLGHEGS